MLILCDTSAILMLLRIAPDMFIDPRYECVTIRSVCEELTRTPKFKTKYPWLRALRGNIKPLPASVSDSDEVQLRYEAITALNQAGPVNPKTGRLFDLSREDRWIIACAAAYDYIINSGDKDLCDFALHHFDVRAISPLEAINTWVTRKLLVWDKEKQIFLKAWADQNEKPQPAKAKKLFRKLTRYQYVGS